MKHIDNEKFDQLVAEKKFDEAKALLREFFEGELEEANEGELYVEMMTEYLEMSNVINAAYIAEMQRIKEQLQELDDLEKQAKDAVDARQIRKDIENL